MKLIQSPNWDHRQPISELIALHPLCLYEADYKPHWDDLGALPVGAIHLRDSLGSFTSLGLAADGWVYIADTSMGDADKLALMPTVKAVELMESKEF